MKVLEVININRVFDAVMLQGAPMDDVKAVMRFRRETTPIVNVWNALVKDAVQKLNGEAVTEEQLNAHLNEALGDEANREVEITPFVISEDGEAVILSKSDISCGQWKEVKQALMPAEKKEEAK